MKKDSIIEMTNEIEPGAQGKVNLLCPMHDTRL